MHEPYVPPDFFSIFLHQWCSALVSHHMTPAKPQIRFYKFHLREHMATTELVLKDVTLGKQ